MLDKKILIHVSGWPKNKLVRGGTMSLYKLCYELNKLGVEAYTTVECAHLLHDTKIPYKLAQNCNMDDFIVVYTEGILRKNPLNAKHIIRWNLHPYTLQTKSDDFYQPYNLFFNFHNTFLTGDIKMSGLLYCVYIDSVFKDKKLKRADNAFIVHKGDRNFSTFSHPSDAINLDALLDSMHWNMIKIADFLNTIKRFYCYDTNSGWAVLAACCGCEVVVIPDKRIPEAQWYDRSPYFKYGVSYGLNNIEHARSTLCRVADNIKTVDEYCTRTVLEFIKICALTFNKN